MAPAQSKRWCFTLNTPTPEELISLRSRAEQVTYLVLGHEVAPTTGRSHIQGFVVFRSNHRKNTLIETFNRRAHYEVARGTSKQASDYCKKEGDFEEFGQIPGPVGRTNIYEQFRDWILEQPTKPTEYDVAMRWTSIFARSQQAMRIVDVIYPYNREVVGDYRPHQQRLHDLLIEDPDDRKIYFIIDGVGNTGKSWFIRKFLTQHSSTQHLSVGRIEDLNYAIDPSKRVFLFDIPRTRLQFLQYSVLEGLKDGAVMSTKYFSQMKRLDGPAHVVVFTNEEPDMAALSIDRYKIIRWRRI